LKRVTSSVGWGPHAQHRLVFVADPDVGVLDDEGHDLPGVPQAHVDPVTRVVDTLRR